MIESIFCGLLLVIGSASIFLFSKKPSNQGDWAPEVALLPSAKRVGSMVSLYNIRSFRYDALSGAIMEQHFQQTISLEDICTVDLFVEPFSVFTGPAHTFLSFGLKDGEYIACSVEVRRENKQRHASFWLSLFNQYRLIYLLADEEDAVYLRSHIRKDSVYLYQLRLTAKQSRQIFLYFMDRMNGLQEVPEMYNIFVNTCTTNIWNHLNQILETKIPFHWSFVLPAFFPQYLIAHNLIETEGKPFLDFKRQHFINHRPKQYPHLSFSEAIRMEGYTKETFTI